MEPTTPMIHGLKPRYTMCNNDTDCERHKFERCRKFRIGHPGKCMCIAGHSWTKDRKACTGKVKIHYAIYLSHAELKDCSGD